MDAVPDTSVPIKKPIAQKGSTPNMLIKTIFTIWAAVILRCPNIIAAGIRKAVVRPVQTTAVIIFAIRHDAGGIGCARLRLSIPLCFR